MEFSYVDLIILIPLLIGIYHGFTKGLILSVSTLVGLVLGVWGGVKFSHLTAQYLFEKFQIDIPLVAFGVTFLGIVIGMYLLGKLLTKFVEIAALGIFNKIGGALFGLIKIALILAVVLIFFESMNQNFGLVQAATLNDSVMYTYLKETSDFVFPYLDDLKTVTDSNSIPLTQP